MVPPPISMTTGSPFFRHLLLGVLLAAFSAWGQVLISEVCPRDRSVLPDEDGDHNGWVELHNAGPAPANLDGYGLSDDASRPFRWTLPAITLPAATRLIVYTSGKDRKTLPSLPPDGEPTLSPNQIPGLRWWVDASDEATVHSEAGQVVLWKDKSGRKPADELPPMISPAELDGKILWLDSSVREGLEMNDGKVGAWLDREGNVHARQPDTNQQPALIANPGSVSALEFDGDNDVLLLDREVSAQTLVWVGTESPSEFPSLAPLVGHSSRYDFHRGNGNALLGTYPEMSAGILGAKVFLNGSRINPQNTRLAEGRNVVIIVGAGAFNNLAADRLLPGRYWRGTVSEVIAFDRALTGAEVAGLDRHLRSKWEGAPDTLAADYSAHQSRPAWRPQAGVDSAAGLPAVSFDGKDDRFSFPEVREIRSAFFVLRESEFATDAFRPFLGHSSSGELSRGSDSLLLHSFGPNAWIDGQPVNPVSTRPPSGRFLLTLLGGPFVADSLAMDRLLDDRLFEGDIHEIALFERELSAAEQAALTAYFNRKWRLPDRRLHANFSLRQAGESLFLTDSNGQRRDSTPAIPSKADVAYGRINEGADWGWFIHPTPGRPNGNAAASEGISPTPVLNPPGGVYAAAPIVSLQLPSTVSGEARILYTTDGSTPRVTPDNLWMEDEFSAGTITATVGDHEWAWTSSAPIPTSGRLSLRSGTVPGVHQFLLKFPDESRKPESKGTITVEVWCDPVTPPRTVMLQFKTGGAWKHRAYWGEDLIVAGTNGTASRLRLGELPSPGHWTRLEMPVSELDLVGQTISDIAFTLFDGRAAFDALGYSPELATGIYRGPLPLTNSTVLRAMTIAPGRIPGDIVTASYLIPPSKELPTLSLVTDPANLFDENSGIYAAGPPQNEDGVDRLRNYQRNWERPAHAALFETNGSPGFALDCGLKIHGAFSRHWPQKSLRLHFRERYGASRLEYRVFPDKPREIFESLILRNSGNDWNRALLRDPLAHSLASDIGLGHQAWRPVQVFLNGDYWGMLSLREHVDESTVAAQNGTGDDLDIIKNEVDVVRGDFLEYSDLVASAVGAGADPTALTRLTQRVNVARYFDWLALELFSGNSDWPGNNVLAWRERTGPVWNWMLVDCDGGFSYPNVAGESLTENLATGIVAGVVGSSRILMRSLLALPERRLEFARRVDDLLNSVLATSHTVPRLDAMEARLLPGIGGHIQRWKDTIATNLVPDQRPIPLPNVAAWRAEVDGVRQFLTERPAVFRDHLRRHFGLGEDVNLTLAAEPHGLVESVKIGTLNLNGDELPHHASYFSGVPLEVVVKARPGYRVAGWSDGGITANRRRLLPMASGTLTVLLERDPDWKGFQFPVPHPLRDSTYVFSAWSDKSPPGTYPSSMALLTSPSLDPDLVAAAEGLWTNRYDLSSRSRINGARSDGLHFVNTGNPQDSTGFVAGALLALDASGMRNIRIAWLGGTVAANSREYGLRLQWRTGTNSPFQDVTYQGGHPVEYRRRAENGHVERIGPVALPAAANGEANLQVRWRYFSIPKDGDSGARSQLRLDDIQVMADLEPPPPVLVVKPEGDILTLNATVEPGRTCQLLASGNLSAWDLIASAVSDQSGRISFHDPISAIPRFYRLIVQTNPSP